MSLAGQNDVQRCGDADPRWQAGAATPTRKDPQLDLGPADADVVAVAGDDVVAGQRQLATASDTGTAHGGHGGERQALPLFEDPLDLTHGGLDLEGSVTASMSSTIRRRR